jgi:CheY-like chemotaxis protein
MAAPGGAAARTTDVRRAGGAGSPAPGFGTTIYDVDMATGRRTILLVEDEPAIAEPLTESLAREGFAVQAATTVADALEAVARVRPDLILLDLVLPDGSGFDVCREVRRASQVPIIMVTARGDEADRVVGLELGADDYVVKPFSAREVVARRPEPTSRESSPPCRGNAPACRPRRTRPGAPPPAPRLRGRPPRRRAATAWDATGSAVRIRRRARRPRRSSRRLGRCGSSRDVIAAR